MLIDVPSLGYFHNFLTTNYWFCILLDLVSTWHVLSNTWDVSILEPAWYGIKSGWEWIKDWIKARIWQRWNILLRLRITI